MKTFEQHVVGVDFPATGNRLPRAIRLFRLLRRAKSSIYGFGTSAVTLWAMWKSGVRVRTGRRRGDEGSIGEWVMILVMAVGITLFIWAIAQPMLGAILRRALGKLFR